MINSTVFIRKPLPFYDICNIYPPKVEDVVANPDFSTYLKLLIVTQEDLNDELGKIEENKRIPTPLEFLLINCYQNKTVKKVAEEAFQLFCHEQVYFLYEDKKIAIGSLETFTQYLKKGEIPPMLDEDNYLDFQNKIRESMGEKIIKPLPPPDPNEDPRIRRIKEKARERDRIKAKLAAKGRGGGGISLQTCLTAICCMGIGLTPLNIGEMSYAAVGELMKMMQEKEKYDIDVRSLLAGADSKKVKPKYWIRNSD